MQIGRIKMNCLSLEKVQKLSAQDFLDFYWLQTELYQIPYKSYLNGIKYSEQVGKLLQEDAEKSLTPLYAKIEKIKQMQQTTYKLDCEKIEQEVHLITKTASYQAFKGGNSKTDAQKTIDIERHTLDVLLEGREDPD